MDAVLVAGDIFENDATELETLHGLRQAAEAYAGPWVLLPGNHDAAMAGSIWKRIEAMGWDKRWHFALEPSPILLAGGRLAVLPAPLQRRHESEDLTAVWDTMPTPAGAVRVGLAHGSVTGMLAGIETEHNPIAQDRAARARLAYLALGDWHGTLRINDRTWQAGTPEPDSFDDNDTGNVLLVTLPEAGSMPEAALQVERVPLGRYRWTKMEAELTSAQDLDLLEARMQQLGPDFDRQVVWLRLTGSLDLDSHQRLEDWLSQWRTRVEGALRAEVAVESAPAEADLDAIATDGFVRTAIERLRQQMSPGSPAAATAADALRLLYGLDRRSRGGAA